MFAVLMIIFGHKCLKIYYLFPSNAICQEFLNHMLGDMPGLPGCSQMFWGALLDFLWEKCEHLNIFVRKLVE